MRSFVRRSNTVSAQRTSAPRSTVKTEVLCPQQAHGFGSRDGCRVLRKEESMNTAPHTEVARNKPDYRRFALPHQVVDDPSLNLAEKRAILAEWASDRSAVASRPTLRWLAGTTFPVTFSSIIEARQELDRRAPIESGNGREATQLGKLVVANFARSRRPSVSE
jgi:hypothetical protein